MCQTFLIKLFHLSRTDDPVYFYGMTMNCILLRERVFMRGDYLCCIIIIILLDMVHNAQG